MLIFTAVKAVLILINMSVQGVEKSLSGLKIIVEECLLSFGATICIKIEVLRKHESHNLLFNLFTIYSNNTVRAEVYIFRILS